MTTTNPTCNHPGCTEEVYDEESGLCWPDWLAIEVPQFFVEADEHQDWLLSEMRIHADPEFRRMEDEYRQEFWEQRNPGGLF